MASASAPEWSGWAFGAFELTPERGLVRADGSVVPLSPKPLAMLLHLVHARDRVVPRSELRAAIWPDLTISDAAFDSVVRDLRRALDDTGANGPFIRTFRSRGLRFVAPVRALPPANSSAWDEAAGHFERALEALELLQAGRGRTRATPARSSRTRGELLVALARAQWAGGATAEARAAFLEAAEIGRRAGDGEILARAALGYTGRTDATPGVNREAVRLLEEALETLAPEPSALRAEVMARLGTELHYDADPQRSLTLTQQALEMADRVGSPALIAYALTARHFALQRPDWSARDRRPLTERALSLSNEFPVSDVRAIACHQNVIDRLEEADGAGFREALASFRETSIRLDQPFFLWLCAVLEGTATLLEGRIEEAERSAHDTYQSGQRVGSPNVAAAFAGQLFGVRREQGRLAELAPLLADVASRPDALPILRIGHAAVLAAGASTDTDRRRVHHAIDETLSSLPRDQDWLAALGVLAPAVADLGSDGQRRALLDRLAPFRDRVIVVGQGATIQGAVGHHIGFLHASLGARDAAGRAFDEALALHRRLGATLWAQRTAAALARLRDGEIPG